MVVNKVKTAKPVTDMTYVKFSTSVTGACQQHSEHKKASNKNVSKL